MVHCHTVHLPFGALLIPFTMCVAQVVSSWGPYTSSVGTAKVTGVAGLTKPAKLKV